MAHPLAFHSLLTAVIPPKVKVQSYLTTCMMNPLIGTYINTYPAG